MENISKQRNEAIESLYLFEIREAKLRDLEIDLKRDLLFKARSAMNLGELDKAESFLRMAELL